MDVEQLLRLKGTVNASANIEIATGGQALATSYPRLRAEVRSAIDDAKAAEFDRLFPEKLDSAGRPWGAQAGEAQGYLGQMTGWLDGIIEGALLERRIQAEAEAKARGVGFR